MLCDRDNEDYLGDGGKMRAFRYLTDCDEDLHRGGGDGDLTTKNTTRLMYKTSRSPHIQLARLVCLVFY